MPDLIAEGGMRSAFPPYAKTRLLL